MALDGLPIAADQEVRVTTNNFAASAGRAYAAFLEGADLVGGPVDLDALEAYFAGNSPISPPAFDRVVVD